MIFLLLELDKRLEAIELQINQVEKGMEDKLNNTNDLDGKNIKELNVKQTGL